MGQRAPGIVTGRRLARTRAGLRQPRHDGLLEVGEVERLGHVVEGADLERVAGEVDVLVGGHHDDRHRRRHLAQAPQRLDAVETGHADVEEHEVRPTVGQHRQRLRAARGGGDLVAVLREVLGEDVTDGLLVVHDENAAEPGHGHRARF